MNGVTSATSERCVIVLDRALPLGLAANAAAVLALSLGAKAPQLIGRDLIDGDGGVHPGLIPTGLPVLGCAAESLPDLVSTALVLELGVIDFPVLGQQTTDYEQFARSLASTPSMELAYLGILCHGPRQSVNRLTGSLALLR